MAQIVGIFRLGRDAEVRYVPKGDAVCNLSLAFNYGPKDMGGKQPSQWIDASLWGKRAESLAQYLTKGTQVYCVVSDPHIEEYEGSNGKGHKLVGRISEIEFAGGKRDDGGQPEGAAKADKPARNAQGGNIDDLDSDIPF